MRVLRLEAENVKRLQAVELDPERNLVVVSGKNGAGKSSLLDGLFWAFSGKKKIPKRPIREGETKARVKVWIGDDEVELIVERTWTEKDTYLEVWNGDGKAKYASPQQLIDGLVGAVTMDPLEFASMPSDRRNKTLTELLGIEDILVGIKSERDEVYAARTESNRIVSDTKSIIDNLESNDPEFLAEVKEREEAEATVEPVDLTELLQKQSEAQKQIDKYGDERLRLSGINRTLNEHIRDVKQAQRDWTDHSGLGLKIDARIFDDVVESFNQLMTLIESAKFDLDDELGKRPELGNTVQEVNEATEWNEQFDLMVRRGDLEADLSNGQNISDGHTQRIGALDNQYRQTIADATYPIEGMGYDPDEGVLYNGRAFDALSDSERIRVSVAVAMALNPKLRVFRIANGSLLDDDNLALIVDLAKAADFQVWIEVVGSSDRVGVIIEDGAVRSVNKSD